MKTFLKNYWDIILLVISILLVVMCMTLGITFGCHFRLIEQQEMLKKFGYIKSDIHLYASWTHPLQILSYSFLLGLIPCCIMVLVFGVISFKRHFF